MVIDESLSFIAGDSAMARLMREKDWSATAAGAPQQWPQSLRMVVNLMLGSAFPMFVAWGPQLAQLYNDSYARILGAKHPASLGRPLLEVWAEISAAIAPLAESALRGDSQYLENLPLRMTRGRGGEEDTWFTFSYSPVQDDDGKIAGMFCACIETTQTVLVERQLRAREEWLQTLFDQAPGFAAVLRGSEHVFEKVNGAYQQITGNRPLLGKTVAQALPEAVEQGFGSLLDGVFSTGEPFVGRSVPVTLNQGPDVAPYEAFIDFMYQPLKDPAGQVEGIFVQGHDVTEQHRALQAVRDADRQKDEFLATLAHELRNPLAPMRTAVHLLDAPGASVQARQRATAVISRQVSHMSRLLDDLIDIARITQRRLVLRKELVTAGSVVEAAMEAARPLADAKRHALVATVEAPQPQLFADPVRLAQVLSNLLNNASKYTDVGGRISFDVRRDGPWIEFAVADTGIGLARESIGKVFDMFAQEQSALDRSEGGLGIGLALVKGLVELHGGDVAASSEGLGQGSRFIVRLPAPDFALEAGGGPAHAAVPAARGRGLSVLLADDNRDAADVLAELLGMEGHTVHTAQNGHEAYDMAARLRPDVLVLDIGMPGLNGYEVAARVRAQPWGGAPFLVAATGWGQEEDRRKALAAGFDHHLTKPFDPGQLLALIADRQG
jgi:signal transduction histidine kinase